MKQALFEFLVRECTVAILNELTGTEEKPETSTDTPEEEPWKPTKVGKIGAEPSTAPDDGGSEEEEGDMGDDAPPTDAPTDGPAPDEEPDAAAEPSGDSLKGVILVNPRDKAKLQPIPLKGDDASIERNLHRVAAALGGSKVKTSISAMSAVRDAVKNPSSPVFVYLGKYDPDSDEIFILADKSLQVAKDNSVDSSELGGKTGTLGGDSFNALSANATDFATRMSSAGATPATGLDENLRKLVKKLVSEALRK